MGYGLLGRSLKHSYSTFIHGQLGGYSYSLIELEPTDLEGFVKDRSLDAYNVTIPYKKEIIKYLDVVDDKAKEIGAVNTVVTREGKLYGYNTDFDGMIYMLKRAQIDLCGRVVMILGSGGTSNTAQAVAKDLGAQKIIVVSRQGEVNYDSCYDQSDVQVIINTTPVGMYPDVNGCPIDLNPFKSLEGVADVIYNPENTRLIDNAKSLGLKTASGLSMLVAQAKFARDLFFDQQSDDDVIEKVLREVKKSTRNVVLIGMPGAGKTTVGKQVATRLSKTFVDIDREIAVREGMTIPEIFALKGEEYFRKVEKAVTVEYAQTPNQVIATGGGIVKDHDNRAILHLNGIVIEIFRPIDALATEGRPLSKDAATVRRLYEERKALYERFRDDLVVNDGDILKAINGVIEKYENSCN